jgi:hypothetical protein
LINWPIKLISFTTERAILADRHFNQSTLQHCTLHSVISFS